MIEVLLIGGPSPFRRSLRQAVEAEHDLQVVQDLADPVEALRLLPHAAPAVLIIDLFDSLGRSAGLRLIEEIMAERPAPIIALTDAADSGSADAGAQALRRGALAVQARPLLTDSKSAAMLRATIRFIARIPAVRHPRTQPPPLHPPPGAAPAAAVDRPPTATAAVELVGIGSSAGGPGILVEILAELPRSFAAAILVVQHLPVGFAEPFAAFLRARVRLPVLIAAPQQPIAPGQVILAPDDAHLIVSRRGQGALLRLPPVRGHRPSIDVLFESLARVYGAAAAGVILSGIGSDGTLGLRAIREQCGVTIAQDGHSAAVNGMPRSATESGAAALVLSPASITQALRELCVQPAEGDSDGR